MATFTPICGTGQKMSISGPLVYWNSGSLFNSCPIWIKISALESHLHCQDNTNLIRSKIFIFTLGRIYLQYSEMFFPRMYHRPAGCCAGVMYYVFSIVKGNSNALYHYREPNYYREGRRSISTQNM